MTLPACWFFVAATTAFLFASSTYAAAETHKITGLKEKITERNAAIADLEKEIVGYQMDIEKTGKEAKSLQGALKTLNLEQKKLTADIRLTENRIVSKNLAIRELTEDISDKKIEIDQSRSAIGESLRSVDRLETAPFVITLLSERTFGSFWEGVDNLERFQSGVREELSRQEELKAGLESQKEMTEKKRRELTLLRSKLSDQKQVLALSLTQKSKLLASTKNKESEYKKLLDQKVALRNSFEQELREFESALRFEIDSTRLPPAGSGVLRWPLDSVKITQQFGKTADSGRLYASGTHNGVDFRASVGTPVKAALSGIVKGTGNTDAVCPGASYGRWVLIEHQNNLSTLYAHFSLVKVSSGQSVSTGDTIGYVGETGYATGPHLHFTVYATQGVRIMQRKSSVCKGTYTMPIADLKAYLDPMKYL